jgi:hypothetical protein
MLTRIVSAILCLQQRTRIERGNIYFGYVSLRTPTLILSLLNGPTVMPAVPHYYCRNLIHDESR